ncbi:MAG: acyltransferase family protein [Cyanobacteria bacterium]|nr:acyltransferase family protein [Cyanobacteriota bacterium]
MPALDGIRAIAVGAVLLYHAELAAFQGGFLGVDVFFALSGFLITRLLVQECRSSGAISLHQFYLRRARRLLPALLAVIVLVVVVTAILIQDAAHKTREDAVAALVYLSNWWFIVSDQSYFETWGRPPLLQHLWSLAIEEQFYVIWPIVVVALLRLASASALISVALAGSFLSSAWMAWLTFHRYDAEADASRAYFGTDTHSMGLLLGAALGAAGHQVTIPFATKLTRWMPHISAAALMTLIASFSIIGEDSRVLYFGGFFGVSLATVVLIYTTTHHANPTSVLLSNDACRWVGDRSYGLYLWHWPIFAITRPGVDIPVTGLANVALRLALTAGVAQASYVVLETPFRKGVISRWRILQTVAASAVVLAVAFAYPVPVASNEIPKDVAEAMGILPNAKIEAAPEMPIKKEARVTVIGDSVLLGARKSVESRIGAARVDAAVGRQARDIVQRIRDLKAADLLGPKVVLHVGTNGYVTEDQLRTILTLLDDRERVIIVNAAAPRRWVEKNNELIERIAADHPNTVVADWSSVANQHPEYFVSDQVHLTGKGQRAFVDEIFRVAEFSVDEIGTPRISGRTEEWKPAARALPVVPLDEPRPVDAFWDEMAQCEAAGDWQARGEFAGGLGIDVASWQSFGGDEFAPSPEDASRDQQIEIANRISRAVGFGGFKCARGIGEPRLIEHEPSSIVIQTFAFGQSGRVVRDLQIILGAPVDGVYGSETWLAHLQYLRNHGLSPALAPR